METRANFIAVGAFMLAVLATGFVFVYWLAATGDGGTHKRITINFPGSVTGLVKGGAVLFNGIKVGEVVELTLDRKDPRKVQAIVTVDAGAPVKTDTVAELGYQGLTGVAFVSLAGGTTGTESLFDQKNPSLNARASGMEDLMAGARKLMARADDAISNIQTVVQDVSPGVKNTVSNIEKFSSALEENADGIKTFLTDISGAAKSFSSLAGRLEILTDKADGILAAVDPESVRKVVENVKTISEELVKASGDVDKVIADARTAAGELKKFAENLNGSLSEVDKVIASVSPDKIASTVDSVEAISKMLADNGGDIEKFIKSASSAAGNIDVISKGIADRSEDISAIIADVRVAATNVRTASGRLDTSIEAADKILAAIDAGKVGAAVDNIASITGRLAERGEDIDKFIVSASSAAGSIETVAKSLAERSGDIDSIIRDTRSAATRLDTSLASAETLLASIDAKKVETTVDNIASFTGRLSARGEEFETFVTAASSAATNIDTISKGIAARTEDIDLIITDVRSASRSLDTSLAAADRLLASIDSQKVSKSIASIETVTTVFAERSGDIDKFIAEASSAAGHANTVAGGLAEKSEDIKAIIDDVRTAAGRLETTLTGADKLIAAIDPKAVSETVESFRSVSGRLADRGEDIEAIIVDTRASMGSVRTVTGDIEKRREDVLKIIKDAQELAARLNASSVRVESILTKVDGMLDDGDTKGLITEATEAARSIRVVAQSFESRSEVIAAGIARFSSRGLREVETMVKEWQRTARGVQRAVSKFERNPQGILFGGNSGPRSYRRR